MIAIFDNQNAMHYRIRRIENEGEKNASMLTQ